MPPSRLLTATGLHAADAGRRGFLGTAARVAGLAALAATAFPGTGVASARSNAYPFSLGVASGSPRPDGVVLWTRLLEDAFQYGSMPAAPLAVRWEIAEDEGFSRIAGKGRATALPQLAHSVHVEVTGLRPDRWYWYRFMLGDAVSPVARTRTAPAPDALPGSLRFAFASCQNWEHGHYAAHRHIAAAAPDLVAFLGDYIYEWGPYDPVHPEQARRIVESRTLDDYRARYAQYKSDPHLQAAHHAAPWIVTWDDHEVANDYAADRSSRLDPAFLARRAAAYQAFYEHQPLRRAALIGGAGDFTQLRLYERHDWGRLARFHVLEARQHRSYQVCPPPGRGGSNSVGAECSERLAPERTLLGAAQEAWLTDGLAASKAHWNILAQQTLMAQANQLPFVESGVGRFWTDGWDGYPAARGRLFDDLVRHRPANPVVISGDIHAFSVADLQRDFSRPASAGNPVLATEFCGTSISSKGRPRERTERYLADNPHLRYARSDRRGFVMMEVTPSRMMAHLQGLHHAKSADSDMSTLASFAVEAGRAGAQRVG
jgi:alkaline phosphatase D